MKANRGVSLIELLIATSIAMVLALLAASFFRLTNVMTVETTSSYLISRDLEEGLRTLRADLRGTALASIRTYDGPGMTMITAVDSQGKEVLGEHGQPVWQGWICYALKYESGASSGSLVRWRVNNSGGDSQLPTLGPKPSPIPTSGDFRIVFQEVAAPNAKVDETLTVGANGGLEVEFVRTNESGKYETSSYNPTQVATGLAPKLSVDGNTRLVQVKLSVLEVTSSTGKVNYLQVPLRVTPRY